MSMSISGLHRISLIRYFRQNAKNENVNLRFGGDFSHFEKYYLLIDNFITNHIGGWQSERFIK